MIYLERNPAGRLHAAAGTAVGTSGCPGLGKSPIPRSFSRWGFTFQSHEEEDLLERWCRTLYAYHCKYQDGPASFSLSPPDA